LATANRRIQRRRRNTVTNADGLTLSHSNANGDGHTYWYAGRLPVYLYDGE
jgi:hypothetical protein